MECDDFERIIMVEKKRKEKAEIQIQLKQNVFILKYNHSRCNLLIISLPFENHCSVHGIVIIILFIMRITDNTLVDLKYNW